MKRGISLCLCLAAALLLCACGQKSEVPLRIGNTAFGKGVTAYMMAQCMHEAENENITRQELLAQLTSRCAALDALDALVAQENVSLSAPLKSECAARVRGLWQFFSAYYRARGITKQDLTSLMTWEAEKKALVAHFYGENGSKAVSEKKLRQWFLEEYVGYRGFSEPLTKESAGGESVLLSDTQQRTLREAFDAMRARASNGTSIDSLYKEYCKEKGLLTAASIDVTVVKRGDPSVSTAFFDAVAAMKTGESAVLENGSQLILLQRIDLADPQYPYFAQMRDDVLLEKKLPAIEEMLRNDAKSAEATINERLCFSIYEMLRAADAK